MIKRADARQNPIGYCAMKPDFDLNQMYYFAQVVRYQGFSAASREIGVPKSRLSRHIAQLEETLQVRLIQRNTRHFFLTDIGQRYYEHCQAMLIEAQAAQDAIESLSVEPAGTIRLSCPVMLLQIHIKDIIADFLVQYPKIHIELEASNRAVDVLGEGFDIAIRVRPQLISENIIAKTLSNRRKVLVTQTQFLQQNPHIQHPKDLASLPSLGLGRPNQSFSWQLSHPEFGHWEQNHQPRLITSDMGLLLAAAQKGVGIVELPYVVAKPHLQSQELSIVLPDWLLPTDIIHAVYPTRQGQRLAVKAFLKQLELFYQHDINELDQTV